MQLSFRLMQNTVNFVVFTETMWSVVVESRYGLLIFRGRKRTQMQRELGSTHARKKRKVTSRIFSENVHVLIFVVK